MMPGMPSNLYLSRDFARSLFGAAADAFVEKEAGFTLFSVRRSENVKVGPVRIRGDSRTVDLGWGSGHVRRRAQWFESDVYGDPTIDARIGPLALPEPVIRYRLQPQVAGEQVFTLPLAHQRSWWLATTPVEVDGKTLYLALAPQYPTTVASAAAGAAIATAHDGRFVGAAEPVAITHGVRRPARRMSLGRPVLLGALRIDDLLVRTRDYGSAASIADVDAAAPAAEHDASESEDVLVRGKAQRSPASYVVYLGADVLGGCSSITYDKVARQIRLVCRA